MGAQPRSNTGRLVAQSGGKNRVLLLSHGVNVWSGGGWEGVVSNNGTLSRVLIRLEGCITSRSGAHWTGS